MWRFLISLPGRLIISLLLSFLLASWVAPTTVQVFYTFSCLLKDILLFLLPFVILTYLASSLMAFERQGPLLIVLSLGLIVAANAMEVLLAYGIGSATMPLLAQGPVDFLKISSKPMEPFFKFPFAPILSSDKAMMTGIGIGLLMYFITPLKVLKPWVLEARSWSTKALQICFIPFLPLYIFGFSLKLQHDNVLSLIFIHYGRVFVLSCLIIFAYILALHWVGARRSWGKVRGYFKEMLPPCIAGFSTMSSAACLPLTLHATEKNLDDKSFADFIVPTTVNIHLTADNISIPLAAMSLLMMLGKPLPGLMEYLPFVAFYCLAKFSAAGVPGGGVLVTIPVVEHYLGVPSEVAALLATLYMLQDPILTVGNLLGNSGFALVSRRFLNRFLAA